MELLVVCGKVDGCIVDGFAVDGVVAFTVCVAFSLCDTVIGLDCAGCAFMDCVANVSIVGCDTGSVIGCFSCTTSFVVGDFD